MRKALAAITILAFTLVTPIAGLTQDVSDGRKSVPEQVVDSFNAVFGVHPGARAVHAKGVVLDLSWIHDHRETSKLLLGPKVEVDRPDVRVICVAPNYRKYDLHAVRMMGVDIELWTYRLSANGVLYFEEILQESDFGMGPTSAAGKNPVMVAVGKNAAAARATGGTGRPSWPREGLGRAGMIV